jgi:hypothetical protein
VRWIDVNDSKKYFKFRSEVKDLIEGQEDHCIKSPLGYIDCIQVYYWNVERNRSIIRPLITKAQISGIRYDTEHKHFVGLEVENNKKYKHVVLPTDWVKQNFPRLMTSLIHRAENDAKNDANKKHFVNVPIQDVHVSRRNRGKTTFPKIIYKQHDDVTCAFDCLSSGLAFLLLCSEASALHKFRNEFYANDFDKYFDKIAERISNFIRTCDDFKSFRKLYNHKRLRSSHNVLAFECGKQDIRFLQVAGKDGSISHAICVIGNLIFDSNCNNALELNKNNLDDCCNGCEFDHVVMGYYFKKR